MEQTEKQFIDLVIHVFTLDWAILALPIALGLSLVSNRLLPLLGLSLFAVVLHHVLALGIPLLDAGQIATLPNALTETAKNAEPLSLLAEFCGYAFLIVVFSFTRQDIGRPSVLN